MLPHFGDIGTMILCCGAVLAGFAGARAVSLRLGNPPLASPVLVTAIGAVVLIWLLGMPQARFAEATAPLRWLLGPALVAMAVIIIRSRPLLRRRPWPMIGAAFVGTIVGVGSAAAMVWLLDVPAPYDAALTTKSVTAPFAVVIQGRAGGPVALAAALSVLTGVIGTLLVPPLLTALRITDPAARGLALGASAHIVATDWLLRRDPDTAAISALALVLVGLMAAVLVPVIG